MAAQVHRRSVLAFAAVAAAMAPGAAAQETLAPTPGAIMQHPLHAAARGFVAARDWPALASAVAALPPQSALLLIDELGDVLPFGIDFGSLLERPMGATIAGGVEAGWAWRFRGRGVASTVSAEAARRFDDRLHIAQGHLERAARADGDDGVAHTLAIRVAKGLGDPRALAAARFAYLTARRRPVSGLSAYADAISAKWMGSEEECLRFARRFSRLDPPASSALLPHAYYICFGARVLQGQAALATDLAAYFNAEGVRSEIMEAGARFGAGAADADPFADRYANSWFAYAYALLEERDLARRQLLAMGSYVGGPWSDYDDPRAAIARARSAVGLEAP